MADNIVMRRIGFRCIELINEQIEGGTDIYGKPYEYSTKPFVRPPMQRLKRRIKALAKDEKVQYVASKKNPDKTWWLFPGGYASMRTMLGRSATGDFLQDTGYMLKSMTVRAEGDGEKVAEVVFGDPEMAQRAFWLNFTGAGKSRKIWRWFGLNAENEQKLADYAAEQLAVDLNKNASAPMGGEANNLADELSEALKRQFNGS